jgi:hypothetical protein
MTQEDFINKMKKSKIIIYKDRGSLKLGNNKFFFINNIKNFAKDRKLDDLPDFFNGLKKENKIRFFVFKKSDCENTYGRLSRFFGYERVSKTKHELEFCVFDVNSVKLIKESKIKGKEDFLQLNGIYDFMGKKDLNGLIEDTSILPHVRYSNLDK